MKKLLLLLVLATMLTTRNAKAALVRSYSLDERSYDSTDVVGGIIDSTKQVDDRSIGGLLASTFKVTAVYKGRLKVGSIIQVALSPYYYLPSRDIPITKNSKQLSKGLRLVLFLDAASNSRKIPGFSQLRSPLSANLILGKLAYEWLQGESYNAANATPVKSADGSADASSYRKRVINSIKKTTVWQAQLKQPPSLANAKSLFPILTQPDLRAIQPEVSKYLVKLGNLDLLLDALKLPYGNTQTLADGFSSPKGRELLLSTLEKSEPNDPFRLTLSQAIDGAGLFYWDGKKVNDNNALYVTRIVKLALQRESDKELCKSLLNLFSGFQNAYVYPDDNLLGIQRDALTAVPFLVKLHQDTSDEAIRFHAESAIAVFDRKTFTRLFPQRGSTVSLVEFLPHGAYTQNPKGKIAFYYTIRVLEEPNQVSKLRSQKPFLVFQHLGSGEKWLYQPDLNTEFAFHGMPFVMKQPPELPAGKYHVYLQFRQNGKVISTGNYGTTELTAINLTTSSTRSTEK